jgi:nitrate/nitrite transporter NarK
VIFGFITNRVAPRWVLLGLALVWALAQFPMLGSAGFLTLVVCRIILGAGEGPFSVARRCSSGIPMHSGPCRPPSSRRAGRSA